MLFTINGINKDGLNIVFLAVMKALYQINHFSNLLKKGNNVLISARDSIILKMIRNPIITTL